MKQRLATELIATIPYAKTLGIEVEFNEDGFILILPYLKSNIGNPTLPALHGGAIGGFMEVCAMAELKRRAPSLPFSKPIGINIDYLRRGNPVIANVRVRAWQESMDKPIAALSGHFLIPKKL